MRTIIVGGNEGTNLGHLFQFAADQFSDAGALLSAQHMERIKYNTKRIVMCIAARICSLVPKFKKCWDLLRTHIFPRTRELPQFPISPKPLFLSKNRIRDPPKPFFKQKLEICTYAKKQNWKYAHIQFFFDTYAKFLRKKIVFSEKKIFAIGLVFEQFLAHRSRFFEKLNDSNILIRNSYIPENPRTPPISYISQTVIHFKKPTSEPSKTGFETKQKTVHICTKKKFAHMQSFSKKKSRFFGNFFFATGLIFERFLAPRSRFFEKVNGLGVLGRLPSDFDAYNLRLCEVVALANTPPQGGECISNIPNLLREHLNTLPHTALVIMSAN
ncbi:hypothetical protein LXL04_004485 [Taraxacum kok-saghyz]